MKILIMHKNFGGIPQQSNLNTKKASHAAEIAGALKFYLAANGLLRTENLREEK